MPQTLESVLNFPKGVKDQASWCFSSAKGISQSKEGKKPTP